MIDPRIEKVLMGLKAGTINETEADAFLRAYCRTTLSDARAALEPKTAPIEHHPTEQAKSAPIQPIKQVTHEPTELEAAQETKQPFSPKKAVITMWLLALIIIPVILLYAPDITANLALDVPQENITAITIPIDQPITSLHVSGLLYGDGNATLWFDTTNGSLLIATIASDDGTPRTDKAGYTENESVDVINKPEGASYYLDDGTATTPVDLPFPAPANDTELLVVTTSETYRLPIIIGTADRVIAFTSLCGEACTIEPANGTLRVETQGAQVQLTSIDAGVLVPNTAPAQTAALPALTVTSSSTLDLAEYFTDSDGDDLQYAVGNNEHVSATIEGSILTLTAVSTGTSQLTVYASDLQELVPATMDVTSAPTVVSNETNATNQTETPANQTLNQTTPPIETPTINTTLNETSAINETPVNTTDTPITSTNATTLDCSAQNPNDRPAECLLLQEEEYFVDQDIFWENGARERQARFTIIGNLLITGNLVEYSTAQPSANDFQLGYVDRDLNSISTIWISDGDLHLRGSLREENANLNPPAGTYTIGTKRGIYVAYADLDTGDLYLRGNLIPYRRSIE